MWTGNGSEAALAGWDMVETGRILVPHFLDQPFVDHRPPGAWWLIAATCKLTGVRNTWTACLPSALAVHRFTDQSSKHVEAFYWYFLRLPELLGPVLFFLPLLPIGWMKASPTQRRGPLGLFLISAATMFFVYCLFASKQTHYLVPLLPALALALGRLIEDQRLDEGRYLSISTLIIATLNPLIIPIWIFAAPNQMHLESAFREWGMPAILVGIVTGSWVILRAGRRRTSWKTAWISCIIALAFFVGDIYQRAGNTLLSRQFAEKVAQAVPDNGRLGTLDDHAALLFHLGRPVEYIEVANANNFLENSNHYLIVHKEPFLQQIDEKLRRIIVSGYPYRNRQSAYLLQGRQLQDNSRLNGLPGSTSSSW